MSAPLLIVIAIIFFVIVIFQLAKTTEYVSMMRGEEKATQESTRINGRLFLVFMILGIIALFWSVSAYKKDMVLHAVSVHGQWIDSMFNTTLFFTGIVFLLTQIALFYFAWRYKHTQNSKALYYPENNRLEMWWTIIPAIVLTTLVVIGLYRWFQITSPAPQDALQIEVTGRQFNWMFRYPGKDGKLGDHKFGYIDDVNAVGINFDDSASRDDFMPSDLHVVVNKPANLLIRSRDVIHDVGIPYLRVKMDAVPGLTTLFWFIPTETTAQMRAEKNDPNFNYELACDQLCGKGHFGMKAIVVVETQEEFDKWQSSQQSFYASAVKGTPEEQKFADLVKKQNEKEKMEEHKSE